MKLPDQITLDISQSDIDNGWRHYLDGCRCPIALSLQRHGYKIGWFHPGECIVDGRHIRMFGDIVDRALYEIPEVLAEPLATYEHEKVVPGTYVFRRVS